MLDCLELNRHNELPTREVCEVVLFNSVYFYSPALYKGSHSVLDIKRTLSCYCIPLVMYQYLSFPFTTLYFYHLKNH